MKKDDRALMMRDARGFVRAVAPEDATFKWMLAALDQIADQTRNDSCTRLLLDLSAVAQPPGVVEQSILGEHAARHLSHCRFVASLVRKGTRTGISEAVAWGFGVELPIFECEPAAVAWLLAH